MDKTRPNRQDRRNKRNEYIDKVFIAEKNCRLETLIELGRILNYDTKRHIAKKLAGITARDTMQLAAVTINQGDLITKELIMSLDASELMHLPVPLEYTEWLFSYLAEYKIKAKWLEITYKRVHNDTITV